MTYEYDKYKSFVLTDIGQRRFVEMRDYAIELWKTAGAATAGCLLRYAGTGDSWEMMALVDRLYEIGDASVIAPYDGCPWQHRIFLPAREKFTR